MSLTKNSLQDLISSKDDAQSNQYDVYYKFSNNRYAQVASEIYSFKVRVGDFQIPNIARKSLNLDYQDLKVPIPVDHIPLERSSEFSFRLDSDFALYKLFSTAIKKGERCKPFYERGDTSCLDTISVVYKKPIILSGSSYEEVVEYLSDKESCEEEVYRWTFRNVILTGLKLGTFTRESGGPLRATVSFNFSYISEDVDSLDSPEGPSKDAQGGITTPATMRIM